MILIKSLLFFLLLMIFHETGHLISARLMRIPVQGVGISLKPYPHLYVSIDWPHKKYQKYNYLFAGMFVTVCIFSLAFYHSFWNSKSLLYALIFQIAVETNPFHSDIIIAIITNRKAFKEAGYINFKSVYKKELAKYHYSGVWYIHFCLWMLVITLLLKLI